MSLQNQRAQESQLAQPHPPRPHDLPEWEASSAGAAVGWTAIGSTAAGGSPPVGSPAVDGAPTAGGSPAADGSLVIEIVGLRNTLLRAARMFIETVAVPTALLAIVLNAVGLVSGLSAALGWCYLTLLLRWLLGHRLPGTAVLVVGMFSGRAAIALATSSAFIYFLQPVVGSVLMALLFLGSAVVGRPVTVRLARDFIAIPAHIVGRAGVRRMFTQVAAIWGIGRLLDAAMNMGFLQWGIDAALLSRGVVSPVLTVVTIGLCAYWGWRALRRDGVRLRLVPALRASMA